MEEKCNKGVVSISRDYIEDSIGEGVSGTSMIQLLRGRACKIRASRIHDREE